MQKRFVLWWILLFLLICNTFVTLNINIAIVSMVNRQSFKITSNESHAAICPNTTFLSWNYSKDDKFSTKNISENTGYDWSEAEQNMVVSGYYWFNYVSILPGGILAHKYGSKKVVGFAQLMSSAMSSLIPLAAEHGPLIVSGIRAIQGILSFMSVPAGMFTIMGNWCPPHERGRFATSFTIGSSIGLTAGSFLFGYIGQYFHWKFIFHFTGVCGIIWTVFWYLLVYDCPAQHPSISIEEKEFIENSLRQSNNRNKAAIPWKDIVTSVPLLVCVLGMCSYVWSWVAITTYSPIYLKSIYGLSSNEIGIITSLPHIAVGISAIAFASSSDLIIKKKLFTITAVRKIASFIGSILSTIPLLIIAFTKCNLFLIISCLIINAVMRNFNTFGIVLVMMDMSPKFCGIMEGFSRSISAFVTFLFSVMVNYFTTIYDIEELWKMVFLYTALFSIVTCVIFLIFGTSEEQNWNFKDDEEKDHRLKETFIDRVEN